MLGLPALGASAARNDASGIRRRGVAQNNRTCLFILFMKEGPAKPHFKYALHSSLSYRQAA